MQPCEGSFSRNKWPLSIHSPAIVAVAGSSVSPFAWIPARAHDRLWGATYVCKHKTKTTARFARSTPSPPRHQLALSKSQNLIFGTFWPGKSGKAEKKIRKNPLTNTSNNKLGHWYLYFNPCSVKLGEGLTSFGTHDDVIAP